MALVAGFAVLVAVVAVQHYAGGTHTPAPVSAATSSIGATATSPTGHSAATPPAAPAATSPAESAATSPAGPSTQEPAGDTPPAGATTGVPTGPRTRTVPAGPLPAAEDWTLLGYGPAGLVRYRPASGQVVLTAVPEVQSGNLISFVATPSAAVIRSMDNVEGYLVPDGRPAAPLGGLLAQGTRALPGPDPTHLWVTSVTNPANPDDARTILTLVDVHGRPAGPVMRVPAGLGAQGGYSVEPDGAGYALVDGTGGVYDVTPRGTRLVTHGSVIAFGPSGYLVWECGDTAQCSAVAVDRATGRRHTVAGFDAGRSPLDFHGVMSPDGRYAAMWRYLATGSRVTLVDLRTGRTRTVATATEVGDPTATLVFTPDSRYLLVAARDGVTAVSTGTGTTLGTLPIPPVRLMALRPAG